MIQMAVLGYGTVGSGVVEVMNKNQAIIEKKVGEAVNVKYVLDLRDFPGDPVEKILVHDYQVILNDPEVKIVVEVMGGVNPAYTFVKSALEAGKHVSTSNKELVAAHGAELIAIAKEHNVNFLFEASVGGGIPIIRPLMECLSHEEISEITGILNGTTNYILTKMTDEGLDFDVVLKDAQDKGYAERNPEADVEGYDACRKIAILTSLAYGKQVDYQDIYTEGITKITKTDIEYAKAMNASIKILGLSKMVDGTVYCMVAPFIVDKNHPLGNINDVFNGVFVHGNMVDDTMFYGRGAGKLPTASAVVADVVEEAKHLDSNIKIVWDKEKLVLGDQKTFACRFFVRAKGEDMTAAKNVFGDVEEVKAGVAGEVAFLTKEMSEAEFEEKVKSLDLIYRIRTTF